MNSIMPPSTAALTEPSHCAMEQAAEWYALLKSDEATESDQVRWRTWVQEDPEHELAWRYVESVSRRFSPIHSTPDPRRTADGLWEANTRIIQRRRVLAGMAGLAGTGLLGSIAWRYTPLPLIARMWRADHCTVTGETREVVLADGTRVWLNTATAINQNYNSRERRLHLVTGEIFIDTASNTLGSVGGEGRQSRPFFVDTPHGRLQALGTRFTVRHDGEQTFLAVYDGVVEAYNKSGHRTQLQAGQQVRFSPDTLGEVQLADVAREAWSRGVLVAQDIALREVVAELRRYRNGHLGLAPEVAGLRVFGNFPLADTDDALDMLVAALPVRVSRILPWWVSIGAE